MYFCSKIPLVSFFRFFLSTHYGVILVCRFEDGSAPREGETGAPRLSEVARITLPVCVSLTQATWTLPDVREHEKKKRKGLENDGPLTIYWNKQYCGPCFNTSFSSCHTFSN